MRVFAVVVNWNGEATLQACLSSLARQDPPLAGLVLVDNASEDSSLAEAVAAFPSLSVVRNQANEGYGRANNQGIDVAVEDGAEAVLLVNNDAVLEPGTVARLMVALDADERLGVVGPRVLLAENPNRVWAAGGLLTYRENLTTLIGHRRPDHERWNRTVEVDYVAGCVMLVRTSVLDAVGRLDPDYFAYMEDVDFCVRARRAGWRIACVGEAVAYHEGSASTGGGYTHRRKYMMGVNSIWFLRRFGTPWHWVRFVAYDVLTLPAVWLVGKLRGRDRAALAKAKGIFDGLRGRHVDAAVLTVRSRDMWTWDSRPLPRAGAAKAASDEPLAPV